MFSPITIDEFIRSHKESNPGERDTDIRESLTATVAAKKEGAVCHICGCPLWAIGSAVVGWDGCFSCITGEADNSEDYEIDTVCFD
jgi:hypothetical protein